ncbi:MAG: hypothetical protein C0404_03035 [Verrucomicrobia bacterium]|nr:hypothetical protein [Verrucomicrobiota bacterium]
MKHGKGTIMNSSMTGQVRFVSVLAAVLLVAECAALAGGIPEPGLTMYGVIKNDIGGARIRMSVGTLTWTIVPPSGPAVTLTTPLQNINDQFSYVLQVPFESAVVGVAASTNAVQMSAVAQTYNRTQVLVGTNAATIVTSGAGTFQFSNADRASVQRVDLQVSARLPDVNGNGMSDDWELTYFGATNALKGGASDDWDGDGLSNLKEYLAGSSPIDPTSAFEFVDVQKVEGGYQVKWSSQAGRYYRIDRSRDLKANFSPLVADIPATPQANTYTDATATNTGAYFYRVAIQ